MYTCICIYIHFCTYAHAHTYKRCKHTHVLTIIQLCRPVALSLCLCFYPVCGLLDRPRKECQQKKIAPHWQVGVGAGLTCEEVCVLACSVHSRRAAPAIIHPHSVTFAPPGTCSTAKVGGGLTSHLIPVMQRVRRFISPSLAAVCRGVQPITTTLCALWGRNKNVKFVGWPIWAVGSRLGERD